MGIAVTRPEALTFVNYLINRNVGDQRWGQTDDEVLEYIRRANEEVWYRALDYAPNRIQASDFFTYTGNSQNFQLTGASGFNSEYHKILGVYHTASAAVPSASNPVNGELYAVPFQHLQDIQEGGGGIESGRYYWAVMGDYFFVRPIPAANLYVFITYHPLAPNINAGATPNTNELLADPSAPTAGRMVRHHVYVCAVAAQMALVKIREESTYLDKMIGRLAGQFENDMVRPRDHQHPYLGASHFQAASRG